MLENSQAWLIAQPFSQLVQQVHLGCKVFSQSKLAKTSVCKRPPSWDQDNKPCILRIWPPRRYNDKATVGATTQTFQELPTLGNSLQESQKGLKGLRNSWNVTEADRSLLRCLSQVRHLAERTKRPTADHPSPNPAAWPFDGISSPKFLLPCLDSRHLRGTALRVWPNSH